MSDQPEEMTPADWMALDYDGKVKLLQTVAGRLFENGQELAPLSGRVAELRARQTVLKEIKSALQSAIRAES